MWFDPRLKVWVGNLPSGTTWQELRNFAKKSGNPKWAEVFRSKAEGTGIIIYGSAEEAKSAIASLNGQELGSQILHVDAWCGTTTKSLRGPETWRIHVQNIAGDHVTDLMLLPSDELLKIVVAARTVLKCPKVHILFESKNLELDSGTIADAGLHDDAQVTAIVGKIDLLLIGDTSGGVRLVEFDMLKSPWDPELMICEPHKVLEDGTSRYDPDDDQVPASVCFSYDGKYSVSSSRSTRGAAKIWDALGMCVHVLIGHARSITCLRFSHDSSSVATASQDGCVRIWDVRTADCRLSLNCSDEQVNSVEFSPGDERLVTTDGEGRLRVWDLATENNLLNIDLATGFEFPCRASFTSACFSPSGREILATSYMHNDKVRLVDAETGELMRSFGDNDNQVTCARFSPDGLRIATTSYQHVSLYEVHTGVYIGGGSSFPGPCMSLAFSADGRVFAYGDQEGIIHFRSGSDGSYIGQAFCVPCHYASSLSFCS